MHTYLVAVRIAPGLISRVYVGADNPADACTKAEQWFVDSVDGVPPFAVWSARTYED
jgi:hypothetical protein